MHATQWLLPHKIFERFNPKCDSRRTSELVADNPRARRRSRFLPLCISSSSAGLITRPHLAAVEHFLAMTSELCMLAFVGITEHTVSGMNQPASLPLQSRQPQLLTLSFSSMDRSHETGGCSRQQQLTTWKATPGSRVSVTRTGESSNATTLQAIPIHLTPFPAVPRKPEP